MAQQESQWTKVKLQLGCLEQISGAEFFQTLDGYVADDNALAPGKFHRRYGGFPAELCFDSGNNLALEPGGRD